MNGPLTAAVMATEKPPTYPDANWRTLLHYIISDLKDQNVEELKFLLVDVLRKKHLEKDILHVFKVLEEMKSITESDPWLLIECLSSINRNDIVSKCFGKLRLDMKRKLRPYRLQLFKVGMNLVKADWELVAFLFGTMIVPKSTQENFQTALDLMTFLEEKGVINEEDTTSLQKILREIGRNDLADSLKDTHRKVPQGSSSTLERPPTSKKQKLNKSKCSWMRLTGSVLKGFHAFRIVLPLSDPPLRLPIEHDKDNQYGKHTCTVRVPDQEQMSTSMREAFQRIHFLSDIVGKKVGHVPRDLNWTFRHIIDIGCKVYIEPTGPPCVSFPPWPGRFEPGGGAVIPCDYFIQCPNDSFLRVAEKLLNVDLAVMPEREGMKVVTVPSPNN